MLAWPYYLAPSIWKAFEKKHDCKVEVTEFADMDKGLAKINSGQGDFDILFGMNVWAVGRSIAAGLLRPVNLDYVPNLSNAWDQFASPFYDVGSVFSLPYCIWDTGVMWRNDMLDQDIAGMDNPYEIFWNGAPKDKTHLLSNAQDVLALPMFRDGLSDVNVTDPATITKAKDDIAQVVEATNAQFDHVDYTDIPKGQAWLHQSWSGNVGSAFLFLPKGDEALNVSYYWPGSTDGIPGNVDNDTIVLLSSGKAPVLAHMLANDGPGLEERLHELHHVDRLPDAAEELHARPARGQLGRARAPVDDGRHGRGLREGFAGTRTGARRGRAVAGRLRRTRGGCLAGLGPTLVLAVVRRAGHAVPARVLRVPVLRRAGRHVRHDGPDPAAAGSRTGTRWIGTRRSCSSPSRT